MKTYYIRMHQVHKDKVWGDEPTSVSTHLIRVTRNRLMKSHWEWVGCNHALTAAEVEQLKRWYPSVQQVTE